MNGVTSCAKALHKAGIKQLSYEHITVSFLILILGYISPLIICAVYTEEEYRCKGIAGRLLNMTVNDLRSKGITPVYLVTDYTGFYERYGWQFLCMVQGEGETEMSRMYIHR